MPPGALLSEIEIGRELGVSRTPVGEALQRLAREGLVTILPRRGIVVTDVNAAEQLRLLEFRRDVSRFIARMGVRRAKLDERAQMHRLADEFIKAAKAGDEAAHMQADKAFHDLFAACAHNSHAAASMDSMDSLSRRFWYAHQAEAGDLQKSATLHANIARAIADGDEEAVAASDALADYLDEVARSTLA